MGKILLNLGYLDLNDTRFYLTDVNMLDQVSKADTSSPENNNEIMTGKSTWQFSATILKNEAISIPPGAYPSTRLIFGGQALYGPATIIQSSLVGKIDSAVIYNITGEFTAGSYHLELLFKDAGQPTGWMDSFQWMDDNDDGLPNGAIRSGNIGDGTNSIISNLYQRKMYIINTGSGSFGISYTDMNFESGATYRFFIRHWNPIAITGIHRIYMSASAYVTLVGTQGGVYNYENSHVATSGWDRVNPHIWGDMTFPCSVQYYFILIGKIINSI